MKRQQASLLRERTVLMFLFKKNKMLMENLKQYAVLAGEALDSFNAAIQHLMAHGPDDQFEIMAERTHKLESNADDLRREIEEKLYTESLLPDAREDLFTMLERIDKIPGKAESVLWQIYSQNMTIPDEYKEDFTALAAMSTETSKTVLKAAMDLFGKRVSLTEYSRLVDNNESLGDGIERKMITRMFRSEMDKSDRILLKELVIEMGHIIDRCEDATDSIVMFNIKRHI